MGIGLKGISWYETVQKHRDAHPCECQKPEHRGKFCCFHGWTLSGSTPAKNIHSTPAADAFIFAHSLKRDENGRILPSTERGKRRKARGR